MQERIKEILKKEGLTPAQFADKIGVQRSSVSHILSGRNKPGFDFIQKIVMNFPAINAKWLITGQGKLYSEDYKETGLFDGNSSDTTAAALPVEDNSNKTGSEDKIKKEEQAGKGEQSGEIEQIMVLYRDKTFRTYRPDSH
jgi:transcriptional regulator with XRE-family HTH domain